MVCEAKFMATIRDKYSIKNDFIVANPTPTSKPEVGSNELHLLRYIYLSTFFG